jgi:hypothetical protein
MGFIPESALEKASPELRKTIEALHPGETTAILASNEGYRILKVISREPQGQRKLDDPAVQQTIRETLMNRKDQLLKAALIITPSRSPENTAASSHISTAHLNQAGRKIGSAMLVHYCLTNTTGALCAPATLSKKSRTLAYSAAGAIVSRTSSVSSSVISPSFTAQVAPNVP